MAGTATLLQTLALQNSLSLDQSVAVLLRAGFHHCVCIQFSVDDVTKKIVRFADEAPRRVAVKNYQITCFFAIGLIIADNTVYLINV